MGTVSGPSPKRHRVISAKSHLAELVRTKPAEARGKYLRLDMNESVSGLPEGLILKILSEVDADFLATYPEYARLQKKIAKHNKIKPENICLSSGSDSAIKYIFDAYVSHGDKVLLTNPTFAMYPVYCRMFNTHPVVIDYNDDLSFPISKFDEVLDSGIKLAIIVNPNNPTGTLLDIPSVECLVRKAAKHNVLMLIDEAYFYFCPDTIIDKVGKYHNLVVLRTFSKLCGIAALRLGYAAACPHIIENLRRVKPTYDVNGLAVLFGEKIMADARITTKLIKETNEGKAYLVRKLAAHGIEYIEGHANFVLINCRGRVNQIIDALFRRNVLISGGFTQAFLKDYVRVTVGKRSMMERFWRCFIKEFKR